METDIQTVLVKNRETTVTVADALFGDTADRRIKAGMKFADAVLLAARQVKVATQADLTKNAPSLFFLSERYTAENGVRKIRHFMGYRLGDMGLAPHLWPEKGEGMRDGYIRCCAWLTADGLYMTHEEDPVSEGGILIKDPRMEARKGGLVCLPPGFTGSKAGSVFDADAIRARWSKNVTSVFFPLMSDVRFSDVTFGKEWMYSKTDIFTMTLVSLCHSVMAKASSYSLDALDWIIYRIYACLAENRDDPENYNGTGVWNPRNWAKNILFQKDFTAVESALEMDGVCSFEDLMFMVSPMDGILTEIFIKKIEQFAAEEKKNSKKKQVQAVSDMPAHSLRDALIAQKTVLGYWSILAGSADSDKTAAVENKFREFFSHLPEKDQKILEDIRNDMHKIRKSQTFTGKAKEKKEFYIKNALSVPDSFTKWLRESRDMGAIVDSLSFFASPEYSFLRDYAAREAQQEISAHINDIGKEA